MCWLASGVSGEPADFVFLMSERSSSPAWRAHALGRRGFLQVSAASAATLVLAATTGCGGTDTPAPVAADPLRLNLPAGDTGLFYYGYFLAIAQATLYQKVTDAPPTDFSTADRAIFTDLRDHEVIYRELFRHVLDPTGAQTLLPAEFRFNLATFSLTTRAGVLAAAQQLEDLAAAAYPVLLPLFTTAAALPRALLLKTASVHARHAATVRNLLAPGTFAGPDVVESTGTLAGQLRSKTPTEVMATLAPYFAPHVISVANLAVPV